MPTPPVAREKLDAYGVDAVCHDLTNGGTLTGIARALGIDVAQVIRWIAADPQRSARADEARTHSARVWDEKAETGIAEAENAFELAKAKELAFHYRWRSSKTAPKLYGEKVDLTHSGEIKASRDDQLESRLVELLRKAGTAGDFAGT